MGVKKENSYHEPQILIVLAMFSVISHTQMLYGKTAAALFAKAAALQHEVGVPPHRTRPSCVCLARGDLSRGEVTDDRMSSAGAMPPDRRDGLPRPDGRVNVPRIPPMHAE